MVKNEDIRKAAFELFAAKGFSETPVQNIANALNLQKQSLYSHYSNKNELIVDVVNEQAVILINEIEETIRNLADMPFEDLLKGIFEKFIKVFSDRTRLLFWKRIYISLSDPEFACVLKNSELSFDKKLFQCLHQLAKEKYGDLVDDLRFNDFLGTYFLTIQGYLDWMLIDAHEADRFNAIWACLWNGMKTCFINNKA